MNPAFKDYTTVIDGTVCYFAGLPGYPGNFSRDTLIAGIIACDEHLLTSQLRMSFLHQGKKEDAITGEEPGKIHHEYPGVAVHAPYISTYNGCDTTALYLIGLEFLWHINKQESRQFINRHRASIEAAIAYLNRHIADDIFWEFPPEGAAHFSLHTTYWKDSIVPDPDGDEEPHYPVAFGLVQFQVARGLQAAAKMLGDDAVRTQADRLFTTGIMTFIGERAFCVEQDKKRRLEQISSDELHALAYIPKEYAHLLPIDAINKRAKTLETPAGFACTPQSIGRHLRDQYHGYVVWIFEQALIHYGCQKFGLHDLVEVTKRCIPHIGAGQELVAVAPRIAPLGNTHQLWSVAADVYFKNEPSLRQVDWL